MNTISVSYIKPIIKMLKLDFDCIFNRLIESFIGKPQAKENTSLNLNQKKPEISSRHVENPEGLNSENLQSQVNKLLTIRFQDTEEFGVGLIKATITIKSIDDLKVAISYINNLEDKTLLVNIEAIKLEQIDNSNIEQINILLNLLAKHSPNLTSFSCGDIWKPLTLPAFANL